MRERTRTNCLTVISLFLSLLLFLLIPMLTHALAWSEIMFNPLGNDNNKEFVELVGNETLTNCSIRDSASADKLILHHYGAWDNEFILIMENDSVYFNDTRTREAVQNATVYVIGSAIGNGLGNTNETLMICCPDPADGTRNVTLLSTAYNIIDITGFQEGYSTTYHDNAWALGDVNGTPGWRITLNPAVNSTNSTNTTTGSTASGGRNGYAGLCNESLQLIIVNTKARGGDPISFTLLAPEYASFEVYDNATIIAAGDTLRGSTHTFIAPNTNRVKIVGYAEICGVPSRMTRYVAVTPNPDYRPDATAEDIALNATAERDEMNETMNSEENVSTSGASTTMAGAEPKQPIADHPIALLTEPPVVTGKVVLDSNADVIPWISLFGMVVVIVSAVIFWKEREHGE